MGQKQKSFPSSPKWDDVVSLYLPKLYSAVGWAASSSGSDESKVKGKNCCNLTFFFPLAAIKTWEKSKPDDVFQKLHDSLFDCRFASVPIVLKNPLKNSLQSHTAASTNVIYIGLQLYCFICVCSSFGFFNKHHFYLAVDYWSNWHFIPVFTSLLTPVAGVSHSASQNDAFRHEGGLHLTRKHTKYSLKAWYQRMS